MILDIILIIFTVYWLYITCYHLQVGIVVLYIRYTGWTIDDVRLFLKRIEHLHYHKNLRDSFSFKDNQDIKINIILVHGWYYTLVGIIMLIFSLTYIFIITVNITSIFDMVLSLILWGVLVVTLTFRLRFILFLK